MKINFLDLKNDTPVTGELYLVDMKDSVDKRYVTCTLLDGAIQKNANYFNTTVADIEKLGITANSVVTVTVLQKSPNSQGIQYINLQSIEPNKDLAVKPIDFAKRAEKDPEDMYKEILNLIKASKKEGSLVKIVEELYDDNKSLLLNSAAGKSMHHDYVGGLLEHSLNIMKACSALCAVYPQLDEELLLCAAAVHDIGKLVEFQTSDLGTAEYTAAGQLIGHVTYGIIMVDRAASKCGEYNAERLMLLEHLIASHHERLEWGSIKFPSTPEAMALASLDNIDAKINMADKLKNLGNLGITDCPGYESKKIYIPTF